MIRVVVADDQPLVRMGLRTLIETEDGVQFAGEAADGREALSLISSVQPDVVFLDIRMPLMDGLEVLRRVSADPALTEVRIVMLTTFDLDEYVFEALRIGASGFLVKDSDPADLLRAVHVVADGGSLLSPTVTRRVIDRFAAGASARPVPHLDKLTEREREIMRHVASGASNDEIAATLVISPATVRTHVSRAMVKLGARDRAQLVVFAVQSGLT